MNIEHQGTAGIGGVGHMPPSLGEIPDQPGIHRAEQQFPRLGLLSGPRNSIQNPADLGSRKVGIQNQTGLLGKNFRPARRTKLVAETGRAAILPDYGVAYGSAGAAIPDERGLALIRDTHGRDLRSVYSGLGETTGRYIGLTVEQFIGIVLHPARLGIQLGELLLRHLNNVAATIKKNGSRAGRSLIQCENISAHHASFRLCGIDVTGGRPTAPHDDSRGVIRPRRASSASPSIFPFRKVLTGPGQSAGTMTSGRFFSAKARTKKTNAPDRTAGLAASTFSIIKIVMYFYT